VTQKIAPLVAELAAPERILNFVDRQMSISGRKFPRLIVGHGFNGPAHHCDLDITLSLP
jgi:hypothetical protein